MVICVQSMCFVQTWLFAYVSGRKSVYEPELLVQKQLQANRLSQRSFIQIQKIITIHN